MHSVLVTLRAHGDLTRIEFEDGLLRQTIPAHLDVESTLFGVDADVRAEQQTALGAADASVGPTGVLTFSALDDSGLHAESITEMVAAYATPVGGYRTESTRYGDETERWVGHASPGSKLMCLLRSSDASGAFDEWLGAAAEQLQAMVGPGRVVVHRVQSQLFPSPELDAVLTVRFTSSTLLDEAVSSGLPELDSPTVDTSESIRLLVFEHRFHADPNHWGTLATPPP